MLVKGRGDYFPRSIFEIYGELQAHSHMDLEIVNNWKIYYPAEVRYVLNPKYADLALLLHKGLEQANSDGSYTALFKEFHGQMLNNAQLERKKTFDLTQFHHSRCPE